MNTLDLSIFKSSGGWKNVHLFEFYRKIPLGMSTSKDIAVIPAYNSINVNVDNVVKGFGLQYSYAISFFVNGINEGIISALNNLEKSRVKVIVQNVNGVQFLMGDYNASLKLSYKFIQGVKLEDGNGIQIDVFGVLALPPKIIGVKKCPI